MPKKKLTTYPPATCHDVEAIASFGGCLLHATMRRGTMRRGAPTLLGGLTISADPIHAIEAKTMKRIVKAYAHIYAEGI